MDNDTRAQVRLMFRMFRFVKPYAIPFFFGKFMHSTQGFMLPFIISVFSTSIMYAITSSAGIAGIRSAIMLIFAMLIGYLIPFVPGIYVNNMAEQRAIRDLKKQLFRTFVRTGLEADGTKHSGESIAAINTDADIACNVYAWPLSAFLISIINIVFSSVVVFAVDWRMGIAAIIVGFIAFAIQNRFTKPMADVSKRWMAANADTVKSVSNIFSGALTIRAFNMQGKAETSFEPENANLRDLGKEEARISAWQRMFSVKTNWLTLVVSFGFGGYLVASGRLEFHLLMMLPLMCMSITEGFDGIGRSYAGLQAPLEGAKRIFAILDAGEEIEKQGGSDKPATGYMLKIDNLNFAYMNAQENALTNISLEIPENKMVALVGESGSGKSTLLRTIIGLYERKDLSLSIGDLLFNESTTNNWRKNFAYVDQSCKLFDMTIKENVSMGIPRRSRWSDSDRPPGQHCEAMREGKGNTATEDEITAAATRAAAHDFISQLEEGYDTNCGEKGGTLSGGQRQRIAIARALVKKAPVLVFDEATSALDAQSERHIMETINSLRTDHTILITTHNLENVITADQIVVMDNGRVAEIGTHEELLAKGGVYTRLWNMK